MTIRKMLIGAAAAMLTLSVPAAFAGDALVISQIAVEADASALGNADAVAFWQQLDGDLETALAAELVDHLGEGGQRLDVTVTEMALANAFTASLGVEDSRLAGTVLLVDAAGETLSEYTVEARADQARPYLGDLDVTTISPDSAAFYGALVQGFAAGVADKLTE